MNWKEKLVSRKLWVALGGVFSVLIVDWAGLDPAMAQNLVGAITTIVPSYIAGQGVVDAMGAYFQAKN
jgi:hypothetical protein